MNYFMPWLYRHYISPYLEEKRENCPYAMLVSVMEKQITPDQTLIFDRTKEYYSTYAFLLGLHTGAGLERGL